MLGAALVTGAAIAPPAHAVSPGQEVSAPSDDEGCVFPTSWSELTSADLLGCNAAKLATVAGWVVGIALLLYLAGALALRPLPLDANAKARGTLRRARERLPFVGRAYRPRIVLEVSDVSGTCGPLARSVHELLLDEMSRTSDEGWFNERLTGTGVSEGLSKALEAARPGLGSLGSFLVGHLPQVRRHFRIQLHEPTPWLVSMTAEVLDGGERSIAIHAFGARRIAADEDAGVTDHYLLVRKVAAWLSFQLYDVWPGDHSERPNPVNTDDAESYGAFRRGELLEYMNRADDARTEYHNAISLDGDNVGALLNLALLDSRDRTRCTWSEARLLDARTLVDGIRSTRERARLLVQIQYVLAITSLNRLMWQEERLITEGVQDVATSPLHRRTLMSSATAVQELARSLHRLTTVPAATNAWRRDQEQHEMATLGVSYQDRAVALAAGVAVEHARCGIALLDLRPEGVDATIELLARSAVPTYDDCVHVLDRPGRPITTAATYLLACALARDPVAAQQREGTTVNPARSGISATPSVATEVGPSGRSAPMAIRHSRRCDVRRRSSGCAVSSPRTARCTNAAACLRERSGRRGGDEHVGHRSRAQQQARPTSGHGQADRQPVDLAGRAVTTHDTKLCHIDEDGGQGSAGRRPRRRVTEVSDRRHALLLADGDRGHEQCEAERQGTDHLGDVRAAGPSHDVLAVGIRRASTVGLLPCLEHLARGHLPAGAAERGG